MSFLRNYREHKNFTLLISFFIGLVAGIFVMNIGRKVLLENTGFLDEYSLYQMKYMSVNNSMFLLYVLKKRLGTVAIIALLSSTYLGIFTVYAYSAWLGISLGMLMSASVLRYGIKGVLLVVTAAFPHYLLYIPAFVILLKSAYELCASIYFPAKCREIRTDNNRVEIRRKCMKFAKVMAVVIMAALVESYVNPILVINLLKIF